MTTQVDSRDELAHRVEAFERDAGKDASVPFDLYLPPGDHPQYRAVLSELIRVDMELSWRRKAPRILCDYLGRFPVLTKDSDCIQEMAFEEYRQRRLAGDPVHPSEYARKYGWSTANWPLIQPGSTCVDTRSLFRNA
jgi:hypothetical protein